MAGFSVRLCNRRNLEIPILMMTCIISFRLKARFSFLNQWNVMPYRQNGGGAVQFLKTLK